MTVTSKTTTSVLQQLEIDPNDENSASSAVEGAEDEDDAGVLLPAKSSSITTIAVAVAAVLVVIVVAAAVVIKKQSSQNSNNGPPVSFNNPMYDEVHQNSGGGPAYMDPQEAIMSGAAFAAGAEEPGYLDVQTPAAAATAAAPQEQFDDGFNDGGSGSDEEV